MLNYCITNLMVLFPLLVNWLDTVIVCGAEINIEHNNNSKSGNSIGVLISVAKTSAACK